jgi:predicted ATP-grasp superfamily ATP-dependent carboligase
MTPALLADGRVSRHAPRSAQRARVVNQELPAAVVIGLDSVTGLQTARALAGHGVSVIGVADNPRHPGCRTNVCVEIVQADTSGPALITALLGVADGLDQRAVIIACTDLSVLALSQHRALLADRFLIALPDADTVEMLVDKARFHSFALSHGLPVPPTFFLRDRSDAIAAAGAVSYPAVLKPTIKSTAWQRHASKAYRVSGPDQLLELYDRYSRWAECLIVQDWIEGDDSAHYTCNCYFNKTSQPLVSFTTRKLRQWPIFGGEACLAEESSNPIVARVTARIFELAGHCGLGYLEMKQDARTGEYLIIEPNVGRPTGRSAMAEAAGVELLYTYYCDLTGRPLPQNRVQTGRGTKWIHLRRDFQSALHHWWRGELTPAEWIRSLRGIEAEALFSWRDPLPFFADLVRVAFRIVRAGGRD